MKGSVENLTFFFTQVKFTQGVTAVFPVSDYFSLISDNAFQMKEIIHLLFVFALLGHS